jgi:hypothetical protein
VSTVGRDARTRRLFALAAAAGVHVGVVSLMALSLPDRRERLSEPPVEMRAIGVDLWASRENDRARPAKGRRETTPHAGAKARPTTPAAPMPPASAAAAPPASASGGGARNAAGGGVQGAATGDADRLRAALRGSVGCDDGLTRLTATEREGCQQRFGRAAQEARALPVGPSAPKKRAQLEHELRVDDAFRSYRANNRMDDYPGLRTFVPMPPLLKQLFDNGEPRQPSDETPQ